MSAAHVRSNGRWSALVPALGLLPASGALPGIVTAGLEALRIRDPAIQLSPAEIEARLMDALESYPSAYDRSGAALVALSIVAGCMGREGGPASAQDVQGLIELLVTRLWTAQ